MVDAGEPAMWAAMAVNQVSPECGRKGKLV
jgi:hypothetical protein